MNLPAGILAVLLASAVLCQHAPGQTATDASGSSKLAWPRTLLLTTNTFVFPMLNKPKALQPGTNRLFRLPRELPGNSQAPRWALGSPEAASAPKPGVYEAAPYTCIVVVPGAHPDDKCIVGWPGSADKMPTVKPELRLIPREKKP